MINRESVKEVYKKFINSKVKKVLVVDKSNSEAMFILKDFLTELKIAYRSDYRSVVFETKNLINHNYTKAVVFE